MCHCDALKIYSRKLFHNCNKITRVVGAPCIRSVNECSSKFHFAYLMLDYRSFRMSAVRNGYYIYYTEAMKIYNYYHWLESYDLVWFLNASEIVVE